LAASAPSLAQYIFCGVYRRCASKPINCSTPRDWSLPKLRKKSLREVFRERLASLGAAYRLVYSAFVRISESKREVNVVNGTRR
jgi:hypothetical protein